jgi:F-type H+-transporting ATPase subunit a
MIAHSLITLADISVGDHIEKKVFGLTMDLDTVWATGVAVVVVLVLGFLLRRQMTSGRPGRLQAGFEAIVDAITNQVEGSIGPAGRRVIPLAVTLFVFILVCNLFELVGVGSKYEWLIAPASDINLPLAMAIFVIILVHIASIRARGIRGYVRHYLFQPFPVYLMPANLFINFVEELAKPITLALRLFGNLLSGTLMLSLIAALGAWKISHIPVGDVFVLLTNFAWKFFDFFIGIIQAFIFALLTILYFDLAMSNEHGASDHHAPSSTLTSGEHHREHSSVIEPREPVGAGSTI